MIDTQNLPSELQALPQPLLEQAFTHRSLRARSVAKHETNERLEFLGDAVLELCVSEYLLQSFSEEDEGILTRYRAATVRTESLALVARELHLGEYLMIHESEPLLPTDYSDSLLADTFEAVIGALYLGFGYETASRFITTHLLSHFNDFIAHHDAKDPKTLLQELVQSQGKATPIYKIVEANGPDHHKIFTAAVHVENSPAYTGQGPSKQKAEQAAAATALRQLFPSDQNLI